ncbi:MAG: hypothetical protein ACR2FM_05020 [Candidatus Saccharimonadales bacterium]
MITDKILNNANKVAFLVNQYPEHTLTQIIGLLTMPSVEINTAIWAATELDFITEVDPKTQKVQLGSKAPKTWQFGEDIDDLMAMIHYAFIQLAKKEQDLEENYVSNWTLGYPAQDVMIALNQLVNSKMLATYKLTDPKDTKSTYTFYSLYEFGEQMWGSKQFKEEPTGEEVPDLGNPELPNENETPDNTTTTTVDEDQTKLI